MMFFWPLSSVGTGTGSVVTQLYGWQPGVGAQSVSWSGETSQTFNWNILTSNVSSVDSLGVAFTVTADDQHAIIAIDDQSGWRSTDTQFPEP